MSKAELLKSRKERLCNYETDKLLIYMGKWGLEFLMPHCCHFNATELMWSDIKSYTAIHNNVYSLNGTENLLYESRTFLLRYMGQSRLLDNENLKRSIYQRRNTGRKC